MNIVEYAPCPYCGTSNCVRAMVETPGFTERVIVTCYCDRLFVVGFRLNLEVSTLKIEGEQAKYDALTRAAEECAAAYGVEGSVPDQNEWRQTWIEEEGDTAGQARYEAAEFGSR